MQRCSGLMQDRTTFIIAHRIQSVMHADLILVLENGQRHADGHALAAAAGHRRHLPPDRRYPDAHR